MEFGDFGLRLRIGVPASVAGVVIGIFFAIFEVQGWKVPTALAVFFLIIVSAIIVTALGMVVWELVREALRFAEHRKTTASWVLDEAPGLLDYEPDGLRAIKRFTEEMDGLSKDTQRLGKSIEKQNRRIFDPTISARLRQKRANVAAKSIDKSATYIEKRADLLKALVKDVARNFSGLIATSSLKTEEDKLSAQSLLNTLTGNEQIATTVIGQVGGYRQSVQELHDKNPARTMRLATDRLVTALDTTDKMLKLFKRESVRLANQLEQRLSTLN